uniref:Uncharacterized protein n=1 Tax=Arundo donax TaxID=35708 RepID=A0A0A9H8X2_ARUDO
MAWGSGRRSSQDISGGIDPAITVLRPWPCGLLDHSSRCPSPS